MNKKIFFQICMILFCFQHMMAEDIRIKWSDTISISKKNFLSDDCKKKGAAICCQIRYDEKKEEHLLIIDIGCYMICNESYYCVDEDSLLTEHEFIHFKIEEICARKIRKRLMKIKSGKYKKIRSIVSSVFQEEYDKKKYINKLYDLETSHGTVMTKQKEWGKKIDDALKSLSKYKNSTIQFKIK